MCKDTSFLDYKKEIPCRHIFHTGRVKTTFIHAGKLFLLIILIYTLNFAYRNFVSGSLNLGILIKLLCIFPALNTSPYADVLTILKPAAYLALRPHAMQGM